jgi:hypothetical protein
MSTKTTFKRIALVTVAALGFGVLTSVVPAQAAAATALNAVVGPNGATSLTVVSVAGTDTPSALVRLDVTNDETASAGRGLEAGETITATVVGVPTTVTAKTLAANGGSMVDTTTSATGSNGKSDFTILESAGQSSGSASATVATSSQTNWAALANPVSASNLDIKSTITRAAAADAQIGSLNTSYFNMDSNGQLSTGITITSYYVTIAPRQGATVVDQGAYTFQFQLTNAAGVVIGTKTVKIDFVSAASKSDAVLTATPTGNFLVGGTLGTYDTITTSAGYVSLTLRNRDGGLVRLANGAAPAPSAKIQWIGTAGNSYSDTATLTVADDGVQGADFGTNLATAPGRGTLRSFDGVYGVVGTLPASATGTTVPAYRWWFGYGNAPLLTPALTVYGASVAGGLLANPAVTQVVATASGMLAGEEVAQTLSAAKNYTVPTTTKTATLKFTINSAAATPVGGALITVTPTWTGPIGSANVSPVTSTTGTVYTTDALGNFSVTVTNSSPIDTAKVTLVLTGAAAFGTGTNTVSVTFAAPVASSIEIVDPIDGIRVLAGSANVTTAMVKDQFGNPVSGQIVTVTTSQSPAVVSTTVISPLTTNAAGTVSHSFTAAAAALTGTVSFNTAPTQQATAASRTYTYVATLPVVGTLTGSFSRQWSTAPATLVPSTGIYTETGTAFVIEDARNLSKPMTVDITTGNDEIALSFTGLTAAGVAAQGAAVTITTVNGWILDASNLPVKSRVFALGSTGSTGTIKVLATEAGAISFTATSGAVTATSAMWVAKRLNTDNANTAARFVTVTSAKTGAANSTGVPVTVSVTDRYGNPVSGVDLNVVASGVGSFMGGGLTNSFKTDASGSYTFLANTTVTDGGVAKFTATTGTAGSFTSDAGYVGATEVDATLAAGNASASAEITFTAGVSATDAAIAALKAQLDAAAAKAAADKASSDAAIAAAQAAAVAAAKAAEDAATASADAAAEATDAANAATDAANASAEAGDAATAAAQDAADAVAALSTQVSEMIDTLKKQITALTNLVIKIQKKVKA